MADEPLGLGLSLDDLIAKQQSQWEQGPGKQRKARPHQQQQQQQAQGRGGRGGRGGGGRGARGGAARQNGGGQQQHNLQLQHQQQQWMQPQQQYQQQQQYQLQRTVKQFDPAEYRQRQSCRLEEETGDVVFRFMHTDVVRVDAAGSITLRTGSHFNGVTLASMNDALNLIGIRVTCPSGDVTTGEWSISDGRTLTRFSEGVVLPAKGPLQAARARQLLQSFNAPNHLMQAAAAAASNAAATAAGIMPFAGVVPPGVPSGRAVVHLPKAAKANGGGGRSSVFARLGGGKPQQQQQRFAPY